MPDTNIDKLALEIGVQAKQAAGEVGALVSGLEKLANMTTTTGDALKSTARGLNSIRGAFNKLNDMDMKKTNESIKMLSKSLKTLSKSASGLSGVGAQLKEMSSAINSLNRALGKLDSNQASKNLDLSKMQFTINKYQKMSSGMGRSMGGGLLGGADKLANLYMLHQIARGFKYVLAGANDYIETLNLFNVVMGESTQRGNDFIKSLETIGVDMEQAMRYQGSFYDIGKSLGMSARNAYTLSEQFTKLAYDYSSLYNINVDVAFQKLQAAIVGTVEPIRRLGKDISEARLREIALSLGIEQNVRTMTASEKATLRFIAVMQQSGSAMNDMERTINSPANALRVLKAQLRSLSRELGNIFVPVLTSVLPYLIAFAKLLREIARDIAALFGIKQFEVDFNTMSDSMGAMDMGSGNLADNLDKGSQKAKKLKDHLLGIDELNILNERDDGGTGSGISKPDLGIGGGGDLGLDLEKFGYKQVLADVNSKAEQIYQKLRKWKKPLEVALGLLTAMWATKKIAAFGNALGGLKGTAGLLTGAFGRLGLKLFPFLSRIGAGSTIASIAGFSTVVGGIALAGYGVYKAMSPAIERVDVFGDSISDVTKRKLKPFISTWNNLDKTMKKFDWTDKIIDKKDITDAMNDVEKLVKSIRDELDADKSKYLSNIEMLDGVEGISSDTEQQMLENTQQYYDEIAKRTEEGQATIKEILEKASEEHRSLTDDEQATIKQIREQMRKDAISIMTESADEQKKILIGLQADEKALTIEQASEILKEAKQNKDDQLKNARDKRDGLLLLLEEEKKNGIITTDEQYQKQRDLILEAYEKEKKDAETGYDDIQTEVKKGLGDVSDYIDDETGDILTNWEKFWKDMKCDPMKTFINFLDGKVKDSIETTLNLFKDLLDMLKKLKDIKNPIAEWFKNSGLNPTNWFGGSARTMSVDYNPGSLQAPKLMAFAQGGFVPERGSFVSPDMWTAGEAGKELIGSYRGRTTVMPLENTSFVDAMYRAVYDATRDAYAGHETSIVVQPQVRIGGRDIKQAQEEYEYSSGGGLIKKV